jgi:PPP family 3-phenylpropionic acid transporter
MQMIVPVFFLFAIYGVVNTILPLILRSMGYSVTVVGILLSVFEIAGLIFPFIASPFIEKHRKYTLTLILLGLLMIIIPFPLVKVTGFWMSACCLALYAIGYKGAVPLSDSMTNALLGERRNDYGRVRVAGSIGFVIMTLVLQFFARVDTAGKTELILWLIVPALLFTVSVLLVPGISRIDTISTSASQGTMEDTVAVHGMPKNGQPTGAADNQGTETFSATLGRFPRRYWAGLLLIFSGFFGLTPVTKFFSIYVEESLHVHASAALWALSAAVEIPFMFFSGRFLRRFGSLRLIVFCTAAAALRTLTYILIPNIVGAIIGQLFNSVTYGLYHPAAVLFATEYAPKNALVVSMSLYSVVAVGLASVIGNIIGGMVIDAFGYPVLFTAFGLFPLAALCAFAVLRRGFKA